MAIETKSMIAVTENFADAMLCCVPPAYLKNGLYTVFQVGEASRHDVDGYPVYETYMIMNEDAVRQCCADSRMEVGQWYFTGLNRLLK